MNLIARPQRPAAVIVCHDPFELLIDPARVRPVFDGQTLADLAPNEPGAWLCSVDAEPIPRALWHYMPPPGSLVQFRALPQGGGGDNKGSVRSVLQIIAVVAISYFTANLGTGFGASLYRAGLTIAATALINNLVPLTPIGQDGGSQYSAQAQSNQAKLGQPIPEIFGFDNGYPDLCAQPYSFFRPIVGRPGATDQLLHVMLMVGVGQHHICRVSVGDTEIENFSDVDVYRIGPNQSAMDGPGIGVENVDDQSVVDPRWITSPDVTAIEMRPGDPVGPYTVCPPYRQVDVIGMDTLMPRGMTLDTVMTWRNEARLINDDDEPIGTWVVLGTHINTDRSAIPMTVGLNYPVATGRYQVQSTRTDGLAQTNLDNSDQLSLLAVRGHLTGVERNVPDCTMIAIRVRASGQLSGGLRFRVMAYRMLPVWDGIAWSAPQLTRSPAWAIAQVLRSRGVPDARIDLEQLLALAAVWEARYDSFDFKFDQQISTWDAIAIIARVGRSVPLIRGGRYTVVRDGPQTLPIAAYGMRNIRRGTMRMKPALASSDSMRTLDLEYWNARRWTWVTVAAQIHNGTVYTYKDDAARSVLGIPEPDANRRGRIKVQGIVGENHALRTVAYTLADRYYRSIDVDLESELDGQLPAPLSLVIFQHDVGDFGQAGDVVTWDVGSLTLTTTEPLRWSASAHAMRLAKPDGSLSAAISVTRGVDDYQAILGSAPGFTPLTDDAARERTRYVFGPQAQVGALARVRAIKPSNERTFPLALVLEDDRVHTVDAAFIAPDVLPPCIAVEEIEVGDVFDDQFNGVNDIDNVEDHIPDIAPSGFAYKNTGFFPVVTGGEFISAVGFDSSADSTNSSSLSMNLVRPFSIQIVATPIVSLVNEVARFRIFNAAAQSAYVSVGTAAGGAYQAAVAGATGANLYAITAGEHTVRLRFNADDTATTFIDGAEQGTFLCTPPASPIVRLEVYAAAELPNSSTRINRVSITND